MNNPYAPSQSNVATAENSPAGFGILFWLIALGATFLPLGLGFVGSYAVPAFKEVFASFGADLSALSLLILEGGQFLWFACVPVVVIWLFFLLSPSRHALRNRFRRAFLMAGALCLCVYALVVWALYSPIFALATPV